VTGKRTHQSVPSQTAYRALSAFDALSWATETLSSNGIEDARLDAEMLLRFALGLSRAELYARCREQIAPPTFETYQKLVERRSRREPAPYIVGTKGFMSLEFEVNRDVLIPRPETELLAEFSIEFLKQTAPRYAPSSQIAMDIGTGSGCLAVTIAKYVPGAVVYASDISEAALAVAQRNAARHGVAGQIHFRRGDLYDAYAKDELEGEIQFIASNPPYISRADLDELQPEIRKFEPQIAYFAGDDGLCFHKKLLQDAPLFLAPCGATALEVGFGQAERVRGIVLSDPRYESCDVLTDLAGIERVITAGLKP